MRWLAILLAILPAAAIAHASERMVILTLPTGWYMIGAAVVVFVTASAGRFARHIPAYAPVALFERPVIVPRAVTSWCGAVTLLGLVLIGIWGTRDPLANLLPLSIWTVLWVGLTLASVLFGNLWKDIEPWHGPVRALRRLLGRQGHFGLARFGHWPAVAGCFAFAWFEIVSLSPADPYLLAHVVLGYYSVILVLGVAEGEAWLDKGEFLTVYFGFVAKVAPFWAEERNSQITVQAGWPGAQILALKPLTTSAIAFVTLILASVSFDGLSETFWWLGRIGINPLEFPGRSAVMGINTAGLILSWGLSAGLVLATIRIGLPDEKAFRAALGPMMLAFLPIAAGYHIAHYLIALLTDGQYAIAALSDPFASGQNLLGLPEHWVSFGFLSTHGGVQAIWIAQFAVILGAHLLAVLLSLKVADRVGQAHRLTAHLPMTVLMVVYTVFGLWLLAAPAAG